MYQDQVPQNSGLSDKVRVGFPQISPYVATVFIISVTRYVIPKLIPVMINMLPMIVEIFILILQACIPQDNRLSGGYRRQ